MILSFLSLKIEYNLKYHVYLIFNSKITINTIKILECLYMYIIKIKGIKNSPSQLNINTKVLIQIMISYM